MAENLNFESRSGKLSCTPAELFSFITDIRNFEQFIPEGSIKNWHATSDECSFQVAPLGTASAKISERNPDTLVVFTGDALKKNDFKLIVHITETESKKAEVKLSLTAELNPFLKIMAAGPIEKVLETLITEMEKFNNWDVKTK